MNIILNWLKGVITIGRMRSELDDLTLETDRGMERNAQKVAYLEGKLDGTLEAIHKLGGLNDGT